MAMCPEYYMELSYWGSMMANKWLKDRKGRALSYDDIEHYHHIISALSETIGLMKEVDEAIEGAGGFPLK